jgi:hypothetical protein
MAVMSVVVLVIISTLFNRSLAAGVVKTR